MCISFMFNWVVLKNYIWINTSPNSIVYYPVLRYTNSADLYLINLLLFLIILYSSHKPHQLEIAWTLCTLAFPLSLSFITISHIFLFKYIYMFQIDINCLWISDFTFDCHCDLKIYSLGWQNSYSLFDTAWLVFIFYCELCTIFFLLSCKIFTYTISLSKTQK